MSVGYTHVRLLNLEMMGCKICCATPLLPTSRSLVHDEVHHWSSGPFHFGFLGALQHIEATWFADMLLKQNMVLHAVPTTTSFNVIRAVYSAA
jgi:hypothetical protein